jgi:hypothetical protein
MEGPGIKWGFTEGGTPWDGTWMNLRIPAHPLMYPGCGSRQLDGGQGA